jgi:hypothetical protein
MEFKIDVPDDMIRKMIEEKINSMGVQAPKKQVVKEDPVDAAGPLFKTIVEAAKRIPPGSGKERTGIRFKFGPDEEMIETSLCSTSKEAAVKILDHYDISVSKFCHAALEIIIAEHKAGLELKKKKKAAG